MKPLVLLLFFAGAAMASPILVGPIELTGYGTLANNEPSAAGATELRLDVTGSNGTDTVSISTSRFIPVWPTQYLGIPSIGQTLTLGLPLSYSCGSYIFGMNNPLFDICHVTINGVIGAGEFSFGLSGGWLRVYDSFHPFARTLLAEAQITNTQILVTDVTDIRSPERFTATFSVGPSTHTPEPGTWIVGVMLALYFGLRRLASGKPAAG